MSYRVENKNKEYIIVEKDTELVIAKFIAQKEARALCRSLNLGSGFNGFTPNFFTKDF